LNRQRIVLRLLIIPLLLATAAIEPVSAVDSEVSSAYRQIDTAFVDRSDTELDAVLKSRQDTANYDLVESYALKKIRRLIVTNDFKFAQNAVLVVIDNNLENTEAVEMYSSIEDSLDKQEAYEREQEARRLEEQQRLQKEKDDQKAAAAKEFQTAKTASGNEVYITGREELYTPLFWKIDFGLADLSYILESSAGYNSFRYGLSASGVFEYRFPSFVFGADVSGEAVILPMTNNDKSMLGTVKIMPKMSFTKINKNIFLRAGFAGLLTGKAGNTSVLQDTFLTPAAGIGFNHLNAGSAVLSGYYDYYIGHFAVENLKSAMGAGLNVSMPIAVMDKIQLDFNVGVNDNLFIKSNGVENRAAAVIAVGVENVAK
jgi:hypothetical protein